MKSFKHLIKALFFWPHTRGSKSGFLVKLAGRYRDGIPIAAISRE